MAFTVLMTGATGALGPHLLTELLRSESIGRIYAVVRPSNGADPLGRLWKGVAALSDGSGTETRAGAGAVVPLDGDLRLPRLGIDDHRLTDLEREVDVVVHAGADTRFGAPAAELYDTNVHGTGEVLQIARRCARLRQVLLVSTACVAGTRTGSIAECLERREPRFVNEYERTKWQSEQLAAASGLPVRIARLSTCVGGERSGYVHRAGAIHHALRWLARGLVPMLPGAPGSRMDLISSDVAAGWIARAATRAVEGVDVCHIAAGTRALALEDLIGFVAGRLRQQHAAWIAGQIEPPVVVGAETFELFRRSALSTGDSILARVVESASAFLPGLLYPKVYETSLAERLWGGPLPADCRPTLAKVIDVMCADGRSVRRETEETHV